RGGAATAESVDLWARRHSGAVPRNLGHRPDPRRIGLGITGETKMLSEIKPAILITLVFTVLTGILYPLAVTGAAQAIFPHQANGSIATVNGKAVVSSLIAQNFTK